MGTSNGGSLFDVMGPIMIGPSSSHTAGAVRIGLLARNVAGRPIKKVTFHLYNSFAKTYQGHGTDRGLVAGILGLNVDDDQIPNAFDIAKEQHLDYTFAPHMGANTYPPNTVRFEMVLDNDDKLEVLGHSLGGGKVLITKINDYSVSLRGEYPTVVMFYKDQPGIIWQVTKIIGINQINIASLICSRQDRGAEAFMAICLDSLLHDAAVEALREIPNVYTVRNVDKIPS